MARQLLKVGIESFAKSYERLIARIGERVEDGRPVYRHDGGAGQALKAEPWSADTGRLLG
jgi:hypothetical protein